MVVCYPHRSVPCPATIRAAGEEKYRDPQPDIMRRMRDLGTLTLKQDVFIKSLPLELKNPAEEAERV